MVDEVLPGLDDVFETFLRQRLTAIPQEMRNDVERVARRTFYGTHYDRLYPEPVRMWSEKDEVAERSRFLQLRVSSDALEQGQDIVAAFDVDNGERRRRYYKTANG